VKLVRAELLPMIEQHNGWAPSKWKEQYFEGEAQPPPVESLKQRLL